MEKVDDKVKKVAKKTWTNFKKNIKEKGVTKFAWQTLKVYVTYKIAKRVLFK